jgi:hypothetical protein
MGRRMKRTAVRVVVEMIVARANEGDVRDREMAAETGGEGGSEEDRDRGRETARDYPRPNARKKERENDKSERRIVSEGRWRS